MLGYYRLLLAAGVVLAHAGGGADSMSRSMVGAFFIVSGYLMALTLSGNYGGNPLPFYWNRFLRVYPMHTIVALAVFLLAPWFVSERMGTLPPEAHLTTFARTLMLTFSYDQPAGPTDGMLVGPAWTLPYEILFYLLAPLVYGLRYRALPLGLIAFALGGVIWLALHNSLALLLSPFALGYGNPTAIFVSVLLFAYGGALHELRNRLGPSPADRFLEWSGILLLLVLVAFGSRYVAMDSRAFDARFGYVLTIGMYISAGLMLIGWRRSEVPRAKLAGDLTYPVYLVHWPVLHSGLFHLPQMRGFTDWFGHLFPLGHIMATAMLAFALSLLAGYALTRIDERFVRILRARTFKVRSL